jgi:hypothetical protein
MGSGHDGLEEASADGPWRGPIVGICCSGGGIRAASYALGCLQVLDDHGVLRGLPDHSGKRTSARRATYISAVSGGSYAVAASALIQRSIEENPSLERGIVPFSQPSPELRRLRSRLSYLAGESWGLPGSVWRVLLGTIVNVVLLGCAIVIAGLCAGWISGWLLPQVRWYCGTGASASARTCSTWVKPPPLLLAPPVALFGLGTSFGAISVMSRVCDIRSCCAESLVDSFSQASSGG